MRAWILAASILVAAPAAAERYAVVDLDVTSGRLIAINLDTLQQVAGGWRAWTYLATTIEGQSKPVYIQTLNEFDCADDRFRSLSSKIFNAKHESIGSFAGKPWDYTAPNTAPYEMLKIACGLKKADEGNILDKTPATMYEFYIEAMKDDDAK
jgi:hypothetical protein